MLWNIRKVGHDFGRASVRINRPSRYSGPALRRCVCGPNSANQRSDNGGFGLASLLPKICASADNSVVRSVSKIGNSYLDKAESYGCTGSEELMGVDTGLNTFFGFLFSEIKNIKDLLNCGLQKIGAKECPPPCAGPPPPYLECSPMPPVNSLPPGCCPPPQCCVPAVSIIGVNAVGTKSLLITWRVNCSAGIMGFEVYVDGCLKSRSYSPSRDSAIAYGVDLNRQHTVTVAAVMDQMCGPPNFSPAEGSFRYQPNTLGGGGACSCY